jgi:hypothetical protein
MADVGDDFAAGLHRAAFKIPLNPRHVPNVMCRALLAAQPQQRGLDPVGPLCQVIQAGIALGARPLVPGRRPLRCAKPCEPERLTGLWTFGDRCVSQTTSVRRRIARNTLWALCTAIPIQALRYRFVGYAVVNISSSVPGIAHGTCRW